MRAILTHTRNDLTCAVFFSEMYSSSTTRIPTFTWFRNTAFVPLRQHQYWSCSVSQQKQKHIKQSSSWLDECLMCVVRERSTTYVIAFYTLELA